MIHGASQDHRTIHRERRLAAEEAAALPQRSRLEARGSSSTTVAPIESTG